MKNDDTITTEVAGKKLTVIVDVVRRSLNIKDTPHHYYGRIQKKDLEGYVMYIGYDVVWTLGEKRHIFV